MKKTCRILALLTLAAVLCLGALSACSCGGEEAKKYKVDFYVDGAVVHSVETAGLEKITLPAVPEKDGYKFDGWFLGENEWRNPVESDTYEFAYLKDNVKAQAKFISLEKTRGLRFDGGKVTGYDGTATEIEIPFYNGSDRVVSVGPMAFMGNGQIEAVTLSSAVESINVQAFSGCTKLQSVNFGSRVAFIMASAFSGCTALSEVDLPDSLEHLGARAFVGCYNLKKYIYGEGEYVDGWLLGAPYSAKTYAVKPGTVGIGGEAFRKNDVLTEVTLPDSLKNIGEFAFSGCSALNKVVLPESIKYIAGNAFDSCVALTEIIIPGGVKIIMPDAFNGCSELKIFANTKTSPSGWYSGWSQGCKKLYWLTDTSAKNGWHFVDGAPTPWIE